MLEADLAHESGIGRDRLRELRKEHLEDGVHYKKGAAGIELTFTGLHVLEHLLGTKLVHSRSVEVWRPGVLVLRVERVLKNRRVVFAKPVEGNFGCMAVDVRRLFVDVETGLVRLSVPDSRRMYVGCMVHGRWIERDLWEMVGHGPRSRRDAQRMSADVKS